MQESYRISVLVSLWLSMCSGHEIAVQEVCVYVCALRLPICSADEIRPVPL
jgi:hypothetical protein